MGVFIISQMKALEEENGRLKKIHAEALIECRHSERVSRKKDKAISTPGDGLMGSSNQGQKHLSGRADFSISVTCCRYQPKRLDEVIAEWLPRFFRLHGLNMWDILLTQQNFYCSVAPMSIPDPFGRDNIPKKSVNTGTDAPLPIA